MKKQTKRNPNDLTGRNLKASRKREATLKERVKALEMLVRAQQRDISWLLAREGK